VLGATKAKKAEKTDISARGRGSRLIKVEEGENEFLLWVI